MDFWFDFCHEKAQNWLLLKFSKRPKVNDRPRRQNFAHWGAAVASGKVME
jgi:hypothetical protein